MFVFRDGKIEFLNVKRHLIRAFFNLEFNNRHQALQRGLSESTAALEMRAGPLVRLASAVKARGSEGGRGKGSGERLTDWLCPLALIPSVLPNH